MRKDGICKHRGANLTLEFLDRPRSAAQMAKLLSEAGQSIDPALIRSHVVRGAPADKRGRLRLSSYTAWLSRQMETARSSNGH